MKRILLTLLVLSFCIPAWSAGTCNVTDVTSTQIASLSNRIADSGTVIVTLGCTADATYGVNAITAASGGTVTGTSSETCTLSAFSHGYTATGTATLGNSNTLTGATFTNTHGTGGDGTTTITATLGSGTATCSGTATLTITTESTGDFPATTVPLSGSYPTSLLNTYNLTGYYLYEVGRTPGTTEPTADYTVTITDADGFALDLGLLTTNGSATATQLTPISSASAPYPVYPVVRSALTAQISANSVNGAQVTLDLIFRARL